jgi:hypothetical protein
VSSLIKHNPASGSCFYTSSDSGYRKFEEWTEQYGPIFSLRQGRDIIIVVGRVQAAVDIMEKEGAYTADRPRCIAAGETLSGGKENETVSDQFQFLFSVYATGPGVIGQANSDT